MKKLLLSLTLFSLFCMQPVFADKVNVKKLLGQKWISMESERFLVLSNANEKKTHAMLAELENFNYFVTEILGFKQQELERKVPVILSKSGSAFRAMGIPKNYAGVFSFQDGGVIFARADKFRSSNKGSNWGRSVVLHELVHLLISGTTFEIATPPWFNEGVAEYFSTYVQKKDEIMLGDMSVLGNRFYGMIARSGNHYESVDTESLFKTRQSDLKVASGNSRKHDEFVNKFYARSAGVVHYFNADPERRKKMYHYLHLLAKGYSVDESFQYIFNMTFAELDVTVNNYISGKYMYGRSFPLGVGGVQFPAVATRTNSITKSDAMDELYIRISGLSDKLLGEGTRDKMNDDFEKYIPGFFDNTE